MITGASGGLGLEFARICASKKYDHVLVARNEGKLYAIKNDLESAYGVNVYVCAADLSVTDAALDVFDKNESLKYKKNSVPEYRRTQERYYFV